MVGLMTIQWAWAENALAIAVGVIAENDGPIPGYDKAPLSLSSRTDCLRRALRDIPKLKALQKDGRALATKFVTLGARRHEFVHGSTSELGDGTFSAVAIGVKAGKHTIKHHTFDKRDAVLLNAEIQKLCDEATAFLLRILSVETT